jgi:hypothetical protein
MKSLKEVQDYAWVHYPVFHNWRPEVFDRWMAWYYNNGFVMVILDEMENIAGLACIKPVMEPDDAKDVNHYDPEGKCLFIALVICTAKNALISLGFACLDRFGMRELVCWARAPYYVMEVHKAKDLRRNLFRITEEIFHGA